MNKILAITTIFIAGMINMPGYAAEEDEQIRLACDNEIRSYGITDPNEYQQALTDCIEMMSVFTATEQSRDDTMPSESR